MTKHTPLTDSMFHIMVALAKPRHGYAIMSLIEETSEGLISIGPASMYTIIKKLIAANWIYLYDDSDSRRKIYALTEEGRACLQAELNLRKRMLQLAETEWEDSQ